MNLLPKKYRQLLGGGLAIVLGASASTAFALDADINFAGFASLVYAKTISDDKEESTMYGISNEGEYRDFNKLGFRMDADMKNNLTFTAQILAAGSENYDPTFDWIFATYQIHPEVAISVGRIRVPVFMYSDYLDTSFAYQWIEPPKSVYNLAQTPFKSIEGLKIAYNTNMGDWTSELLIWGGNGEDHFTESGVDADLILENSWGTAWTVGYDWLSLRAFYFEADSTLDITTNSAVAGLMNSVYQLEEGIASVPGMVRPNFHDALLWEKDPGQFYGLGASFDFESFFIISEITKIDVKGNDSNLVAPTLDSFYITGGVRLPEHWTLSLTYGEDKDKPDNKTWQQLNDDIVRLGTVLPPMIGALQAGEGVLQGMETPLLAGEGALESQEAQLQAVEDYLQGVLIANGSLTGAETTLLTNTQSALTAVQGSLAGVQGNLAIVQGQLAVVQAQLTGLQQLQPGLQALQDGLKTVVYQQQDYSSKQTTLSARWDFHPSAALKLEYMIDERDGQFLGGKKLKPQALRIGLDLVF